MNLFSFLDGQFDDDGMDNSSEGSGVDIEELDNLLEENLPEGMKSSGPKAKAYEERFKEVLEEKGRNHFEVLPEGWVQATHVSGMPLFLHTASRVCTASRPYFLGPGSVRVSIDTHHKQLNRNDFVVTSKMPQSINNPIKASTPQEVHSEGPPGVLENF